VLSLFPTIVFTLSSQRLHPSIYALLRSGCEPTPFRSFLCDGLRFAAVYDDNAASPAIAALMTNAYRATYNFSNVTGTLHLVSLFCFVGAVLCVPLLSLLSLYRCGNVLRVATACALARTDVRWFTHSLLRLCGSRAQLWPAAERPPLVHHALQLRGRHQRVPWACSPPSFAAFAAPCCAIGLHRLCLRS
jgi:hypothetical protein